MSPAFIRALAAMPEQLREQIAGWIDEGRQPGRFLEAVIDNDLLRAVTRADEECRPQLLDIVRFFHNEAPGECWGSPELAARWGKAGGLSGFNGAAVTARAA